MATKTLKNGAVYDLDTKRIVDSSNVTTKITAENARDYQSRAVAKKRVIMAEAANSAVQDTRLIEQYGDYAHVAERAQTLQIIASTPDAGKAAVMAHDALTRDTGMAELKQTTDAGARVTLDIGADALQALLAAVTGARLREEIGEVADAE
mgnify:CR=1 FL=1